MDHNRQNAYIPTSVPAGPGFWERFMDRVDHIQGDFGFWWRFNKDSVKGFGILCVLLGFFLCCCYGIAAGDITLTTPSADSDDDFHHHHHHSSMLLRSHSSSRRSRSRSHR